MLSVKTYAFLFFLFVQTVTTVGKVQFVTPLNFVHLREDSNPLSGHEKLNTHKLALSNVAAELLKLKYYKNDSNIELNPELHAFAHQLPQVEPTYWFYMVVFKTETKFISMAILITEDEEVDNQISVLEYYFGYSISASIIHRLWLATVQEMDKTHTPGNRDENCHVRLRGMVFLGYAAAINKWKSVRTATKKDGVDFDLKNIYLGVKKYGIIAAEKLEDTFSELKGLKNKVSKDFEEVETTSSDQATPQSETTILKYLCQKLAKDEIQFGFIINVEAKYVLGVTVLIKDVTEITSSSPAEEKSEEKYVAEVIISIKSTDDPQGNLNGFNVFFQKCQSLCIFLKTTPDSVDILKMYDDKKFGEKRILQKEEKQKICLAKFALTVSPWTRDDIWMGLKYEFFTPDQMTLPEGIGLDPKKLTKQEEKYSLWRSTDAKTKHGNSSWNTIMQIPESEMPAMLTEDLSSPDADKKTWVKVANKFLNTKDAGTIRRDKEVWKGIDFSSVAEDKAKVFPHGVLENAISGLFRDGENPAVDNIYLLLLKDPWGKLVLTPDGKHRLDTLLGQRNGPPNNRAFNGGFVDIDEMVEKLLGLVEEKIRALFVKEICLLNVIKEFVEESFRSTELEESEEHALWIQYVQLLLLAKAEQIGIYKIFDAATGDSRNKYHSFVTVHAYAFIIYDHPELEELLSEENLVGGDDSIETARVNFRTDMYMFANHPLLSYRAVQLYNWLQYPTEREAIGTYNPVPIRVTETEHNEPNTTKRHAKNIGVKTAKLVKYYEDLVK